MKFKKDLILQRHESLQKCKVLKLSVIFFDLFSKMRLFGAGKSGCSPPGTEIAYCFRPLGKLKRKSLLQQAGRHHPATFENEFGFGS